MRIELTSDGGFASIPALARPIGVDVGALPPDQSAEAQRLVDAAVAEGRARVAPANPNVRDAQQHKVVIQTPSGQHKLEADDVSAGPAFNALLNFVRTHGTR